MRFLILFALIVWAMPVRAEDADDITFCHILPDYQQPAGVEYQPGVDLHGKPVLTADVTSPPLPGFETIEIPVEINLIEKFGLQAPPSLELKPYVALVSIHKDGKVDYNGQDISLQAHELCNNKDVKNEQTGPAKP